MTTHVRGILHRWWTSDIKGVDTVVSGFESSTVRLSVARMIASVPRLCRRVDSKIIESAFRSVMIIDTQIMSCAIIALALKAGLTMRLVPEVFFDEGAFP
jgi:hypothetical protein